MQGAITVVGGGDSVAAVAQAGLQVRTLDFNYRLHLNDTQSFWVAEADPRSGVGSMLEVEAWLDCAELGLWLPCEPRCKPASVSWAACDGGAQPCEAAHGLAMIGACTQWLGPRI